MLESTPNAPVAFVGHSAKSRQHAPNQEINGMNHGEYHTRIRL